MKIINIDKEMKKIKRISANETIDILIRQIHELESELESYRQKGKPEELEKVVRCGDCKLYIDKNCENELGFCALDHLKRVRNAYCERGERREKK